MVMLTPTPGIDATRIASAALSWLRLTLRREVAHWFTPCALILVFLLSFFTWICVAPNGTRIYTQNGWQTAWANSLPTSSVTA